MRYAPRLRTIALKRQRVDVDAPVGLVFEVVASAGKKVGEVEGGSVVEFESVWRDRVVSTVEEDFSIRRGKFAIGGSRGHWSMSRGVWRPPSATAQHR